MHQRVRVLCVYLTMLDCLVGDKYKSAIRFTDYVPSQAQWYSVALLAFLRLGDQEPEQRLQELLSIPVTDSRCQAR